MTRLLLSVLLCSALVSFSCSENDETAKAKVAPAAQTAPTPGLVAPANLARIFGVNTDETIEVTEKYNGWPHINLQEALRLQKVKNVVFADARAKVEWDQSHIPGALPVPLGEFDEYYELNKAAFQKADIVVAYCHGVGCHLSDMACEKFQQKGHKNVVNFYAGWPEWKANLLPKENATGKIVQ